MKTSELTGAALDWAVAKCEGVDYFGPIYQYLGKPYFNYSTDWAQGGPIIERERISIIRLEDYCYEDEDENYRRIPVYGAVIGEYFDEDQLRSSCGEAWGEIVYIGYELVTARGETPLIAAMRCYVASKLGDNVKIPENILV